MRAGILHQKKKSFYKLHLVNDSDFGARPLCCVIQQKVDDSLSDHVLAGEFADGDSVLVNVSPDGELELQRTDEKIPEPSL